MLNVVFGTYDTIDVSAYFDHSPCGGLREEESGVPRNEFLEEVGMRPPASDYQSHRKYSIGPTGSVSPEETEERERGELRIPCRKGEEKPNGGEAKEWRITPV